MADEKKEGKQGDQSTKRPDESKKDEISQEELSKVSGGRRQHSPVTIQK